MTEHLPNAPNDFAGAALDGLYHGDQRPLAAWLRSQDTDNASKMADAVELGILQLFWPKRRHFFRRLDAGRFIHQRGERRLKKQVIFDAAEVFPDLIKVEAKGGSEAAERTAYRLQADWREWEADCIDALQLIYQVKPIETSPTSIKS